MAETQGKPRIIQQFEASEAALARRLGLEEAPYIPACEGGIYGIDNYLWDGCFVAEALAEHGYFRKAARQVFAITAGQRPDGFIANVQFPPTKKIRLYPEHYTFMNPSVCSDYTQPPILSRAALDIYDGSKNNESASPDQAINPEVFLDTIYPNLKRSFIFLKTRQNSPDDPLLGNIHPHETGRDSDPTFDFVKSFRIARRGERESKSKNRWNRIFDYAGAMSINLEARAHSWEPGALRKIFWVNDVMFNCLYTDNLYAMDRIADELGLEDDAHSYEQLADSVQSEILERMWNPKAQEGRGAFYALDKDGRHIEIISISNLMPLLLPKITPKQLESLLDMMDSLFDTPYPLPTVATNNTANYDPHYEEKDRHWRGPTWPVANHLVMEGLVKQIARDDVPSWLVDRCQVWLDRLGTTNRELMENGYFEHYNPITGIGQRGHRTKGHIFGAIAEIQPRLHKF